MFPRIVFEWRSLPMAGAAGDTAEVERRRLQKHVGRLEGTAQPAAVQDPPSFCRFWWDFFKVLPVGAVGNASANLQAGQRNELA